MIAFILLALLVFAAYMFYVYKKFGIPYSISETYYLLEREDKGYLFSAMCIAIASLVLPAIVEISPEGYRALAFLACAGLMFVGAAPRFKLDLAGKVHYWAAGICVLTSQIWVGIMLPYLLLSWVFYISFIVTAMSKNDMTDDLWRDFVSVKPALWAEVTAIAITLITLIFLYL